MPFTPSEIKNKEFTRVKNGLEPTEVANYLEQLSNEIERLKEDKKQLEKVIADTTDVANVEQQPKVEGRQMGMLLGPTKKK